MNLHSLLRCVVFALTLSAGAVQISAQLPVADDFPVPVGLNNVGTDFFLSFPANWEASTPGGQQYIRLYITSAVRTSVEVWVGEKLKKTVNTIPYDIVTVDLQTIEGQVIVRNDQAPVPSDSVYSKKAIRVKAKAPIAMYGINRLKYSSDGLLAVPVSALGEEYVVATYGSVTDGIIQKLPSQYMVVAPYDSTIVTITPSMDSPNHKGGTPFTITLHQGDVFSAMSTEMGGDLTGTVIQANKPVAVTAGNSCTFIPNEIQYCCCDHLTEMMLPVSTWGTTYHVLPIRTRAKGPIYRVLAGEAGAKVYVNGTLLGTLPKKGGTDGVGFLEFRQPTLMPVEFTSDKPIMVAQYNTSQYYEGPNGVPTDPFFLVLTPVEQYQKELVFTTPKDDFQDSYVCLVGDSATFDQIEIATDGRDTFRLLGQQFPATKSSFPTAINGKIYSAVSLRIPPGSYRLRAPEPMAGYLYGFSSFDSYGYPLSAAAAVQGIADQEPPIVIATVKKGSGVSITVRDQPDNPMQRTNLAYVWPDPDTTSLINARVIEEHFRTGEQVANYRLEAIDPTKDASAVIITSDRRGNIRRDTVRYIGSQIGSSVPVPSAFSASDIHFVPNPATGSSAISFNLDRAGIVTAELYDGVGKRVMVIAANQPMQGGTRFLPFDTEGLMEGIYRLRLVVNGEALWVPSPLVVAHGTAGN